MLRLLNRLQNAVRQVTLINERECPPLVTCGIDDRRWWAGRFFFPWRPHFTTNKMAAHMRWGFRQLLRAQNTAHFRFEALHL